MHLPVGDHVPFTTPALAGSGRPEVQYAVAKPDAGPVAHGRIGDGVGLDEIAFSCAEVADGPLP